MTSLTHVSARDVAQAGEASDAKVKAPHIAAILLVWRRTGSSCSKVIIVRE